MRVTTKAFLILFLLARLCFADAKHFNNAIANYWNPNQQTTCRWWLDARNDGKITNVSGKTSQWDDLCSHGYSWTQSTAGARFTPTASAVNGQQCMATTGSTGMSGPASTAFISTGAAWTLAVAGKITGYNGTVAEMVLFGTTNSNKIVLASSALASGTYQGLNLGNSDNVYKNWFTNQNISTGTVFKFVVTYSGSSPTSLGSYTVSWNGTAQTLSASPGAWGNGNGGSTVIGVIPSYDNNFGLSGYFCELAFFDEANATLTSKLNNYLASWGI